MTQTNEPPEKPGWFSKYFVNFSHAVSNAAAKRMRQAIRAWQLGCRVDKRIDDLARMFNPIIRGWLTYYGRYYPSALYPTLRYLDGRLARWAQEKYKRLRRHRRRSEQRLRAIAHRDSRLFAHWRMLHRGGGWTVRAGCAATRTSGSESGQRKRVGSRRYRASARLYMADALYCGRRLRTFNVIDDHNREALAIEIDTSITGLRLIRVFERLKAERGLPAVLRVDNGPEFLSSTFAEWASDNGMSIRYIQPGEPNQNAYIERFNRTYRDEVLDLYLFRDLHEVREFTHWWLIDYNEQRPHESLGDLPPVEYVSRHTSGSRNTLST